MPSAKFSEKIPNRKLWWGSSLIVKCYLGIFLIYFYFDYHLINISESISIGEIVSGGSDSTNVHGFQPVSQSPVNSSVDGIFNGTPSNTPHNFPSMRSGSFGNHSDFSHSPGMRNFGFHPMQNFHPHSLPENQGNIPQRIPYNMENSISTMAANISRSTEDIDNRNISVGLARFGGQNGDFKILQ